ncbi:hypothetical protein TcasGA2_TC004166 [Tribolium castaneum]|uniref:Tc1-like transposase DDE domain-containing protein n=1 Tax=Tribolium castaneum TaxID=7070 RepID=D7EJC0_TRICA|nr:hypothetical protein TcasGA2_TC004166 [Tribolium castaneum]
MFECEEFDLKNKKAKSDDYHDNMSAEVFEKWLLENLSPSLENPTIIVLDNASYHSRVEERQSSTSWKKDEIKRWLEEKKIVHPQNAFKQELLATAKSNKQNINYKVDKLVEEHGHKVLRLPPYHCHYNPIEQVWALSKTFYDKHIGKVDYTDESILQTWQRVLNQVTPEVWSNTVNHCDKLIEEDIKKQICLDQVQKEIFINVNSDNDSDSDFGEFDDTASGTTFSKSEKDNNVLQHSTKIKRILLYILQITTLKAIINNNLIMEAVYIVVNGRLRLSKEKNKLFLKKTTRMKVLKTGKN